jgi:hypothetical protein
MCQWKRETPDKESKWHQANEYQPEQVVNLLRQIEAAIANGKATAQGCKETGMVEQSYFRWREEYSGNHVWSYDFDSVCEGAMDAVCASLT